MNDITTNLNLNCPSESQMIAVSDGLVFVQTWIPKNLHFDTPVVLLHDSLGCVQMWRDFPEQLAIKLNRKVIAYDRLGYGQSSEIKTPAQFDFIEHEAQVLFPSICSALNLTQVILFGHSVGGGMAITIAGHHDTSALCAAVITESAQAFVEQRTLDGIIAAKKSFSDADQFSKLSKYHGDKAQWVLDAWTDTWLDPIFEHWNLDEPLKNVDCPVLAIHGNRDEFGSTDFPNRIANGVSSHSKSIILENIGHVPHRENPEIIISLVSDFLIETNQ